MTTTRPKFPLHDISPDTDAATIAEWEREWDLEMEDREQRGALQFTFEQDRDCGFMIIECTDGDSRTALLNGTVEVELFEAAFVCEAFGLTPNDLRNNPFEYVDDFILQAANDEHVGALSSRPNLASMDIVALIHDPADDIDEEALASLSDEEREDAEASIDQQRAWLEAGKDQAALLTDACLPTLPVSLKILQLRDTQFSDDAVASSISRMTQLESLGLQSDRLTGTFLAALEGREELGDLALTSEALDGAAIMEHLPTLPALEGLLLVGPKVCDGLDGAELAARVPALQELTINPDTITDEQRLRLAMALPGVNINGILLSEKAIKKAAEKAGIEL